MRVLKFDKVNQLIVVSAKGDDPVYREKFSVREASLSFSFVEYVKSQLHINVVTELLGRNIFAYLNTYKFLKGENILGDEAIKVLHYFYEDVANFLIRNPANMKLSIIINPDGESDLNFSLGNIQEWQEFSQVKDFLENLMEAKTDLELFQIIQNSKYSFILDYVLSLEDIRKKLDSWILATSILSYLAQGVSIENLIEFRGGNNGEEN